MAHTSGTISAKNIINAASRAIGDPTGNIVTRMSYKEFVSNGLTLLFHQVPFDRRFVDAAIPQDRMINVKGYVAGISKVLLYNGQNCDVQNSVRVMEKTGYVHFGGEGGFRSNDWENSDDITQSSAGNMSEPHNAYYYGWMPGKEGVMHLSPQCASYERIHIEYAGIGHDRIQEEDIQVPIWAEEAIRHYVCMRGCEVLLHFDGKTEKANAQMKNYSWQYTDINGSWANAKAAWGGMDLKEQEDVSYHFLRLGWTR